MGSSRDKGVRRNKQTFQPYYIIIDINIISLRSQLFHIKITLNEPLNIHMWYSSLI